MNRLEQRLDDLKKENKKALVAFITGGDPSIEESLELALCLEKSGVDILEIGVPFSDPLADGPVISKSYYDALDKGIRIKEVFSLVEQIREKSRMPLVLMVYYNIAYCYGVEKFIKKLKAIGVDGVIIPDIPLEEREELNGYCNEENICLIPLVAPTSNNRIEKIVKGSKGFVYCVSRRGTTGSSIGVSEELIEYLKFCKSVIDNPCLLGFGISSKESAKEVKDYCDGVIIGSAIIQRIHDCEEFSEGLREVEGFIRGVRGELNS